jgi:hypothetical protein
MKGHMTPEFTPESALNQIHFDMILRKNAILFSLSAMRGPFLVTPMAVMN